MKTCLATAIFLTLPTLACSQDLIGTATGTVDGVDHEWFFTVMDGTSQSDYREMGPFTTVSLLGHPTPDTIMSTKEGFMLSWTIYDMDNPAGSEVELRYMPESSFMKGYVQFDDQPVVFDLTTFEPGDDGLHVAGTASATLGWSETPGFPPEADNTADVLVTFDVVVPPAQ